MAQRIAETLREPFTVDDHQVSVSTSVGIALGTAHANDDPEGMLREADVAMYRARSKAPAATRCSTRPCRLARRNVSS